MSRNGPVQTISLHLRFGGVLCHVFSLYAWLQQNTTGRPSPIGNALYDTNCTSLAQHSQSLTSLLLERISWSNVISGVTLPSLTYLSLYNMRGLKPHINAPCLATYHEGGFTEFESFSAPLHSLVEYGEFALGPGEKIPGDIAITSWHDSFPNITRIAIRGHRTRSCRAPTRTSCGANDQRGGRTHIPGQDTYGGVHPHTE
jgi:hypothetical protein